MKIFSVFYQILKSVSTKVIIVIIVLVLPMNILAIRQSNIAMETVVERGVRNIEGIVNVQMNELKRQMENQLFLLSYLMTNDSDCIQMKAQSDNTYEYDRARNFFYVTLKNMASVNDGSDGYFYYMHKKDDLLIYSKNENRKKLDLLKNYICTYTDSSDLFGWNLIEISDEKYYMLFLHFQDLTYGGWFRLGDIEKEIQKQINYRDCLVQFNDSCYENSEEGALIVNVGEGDLWINVIVDREEIIGSMTNTQRVMRVLTIFMIVVIPLLYVIMHRLLIRPLLRLNRAHAEIRNGNSGYRIQGGASSAEFEEAYHSFNQMMENIERLKIKSYEQEISKKKMELKNLQLQIRPHFLQNTFNLIFTLIQRGENETVQDIVLYLSEYFRYIFRTTKELELFDKELNLIKGYMNMVDIRYKHLISVEYDLDPEISFIRTPPLLIHNFIENAVKHAFDGENPMIIRLEGFYQNGTVTFIISDNGCGMSEKTAKNLQYVLEMMESEENNVHVGLKNSIRRLKYFYGEDSSIQVETVEGEGTSFIIMFPYNLKEEE